MFSQYRIALSISRLLFPGRPPCGFLSGGNLSLSQFIGEKFLKVEIPLDLYKSIENNFAKRLAAEEENQFMIDVKWANEFLEK